MIRYDYKDGPKTYTEQAVWERVNFGTDALRRAYRLPRPFRRFLQMAVVVKSNGDFVRNDAIDFLSTFDRRRRLFFRDRELSRPTETMCVRSRGLYDQSTGKVIVTGALGSESRWFDFSNRPHERYQAATNVRIGRELRFPEDAPSHGRLVFTTTADGRNVDISNGEHVVFRIRGEDLFSNRPHSVLSMADADEILEKLRPKPDAKSSVVDLAWPDRQAVIMTNRRPIVVAKAHWRHGAPMYREIDKRMSCDLSHPAERRIMASFCEVVDHANQVARNLNKFSGVVTAEDWSPEPYVGFQSRQALQDAMNLEEFVPTEDLVSDIWHEVQQTGFVSVSLVEHQSLIEYVVPVESGGVLIGFVGGAMRRFPLIIDQPAFLRSGTGPPEPINDLEALVGRLLPKDTELLYSASEESFVSFSTMVATFPDCWRHIVGTFVNRFRHVFASYVVVPARYVESISTRTALENGNSVLVWRVVAMEPNRDRRMGLYMAPPIYMDLEFPGPFTLRGVQHFAGTPEEYVIWKDPEAHRQRMLSRQRQHPNADSLESAIAAE